MVVSFFNLDYNIINIHLQLFSIFPMRIVFISYWYATLVILRSKSMALNDWHIDLDRFI